MYYSGYAGLSQVSVGAIPSTYAKNAKRWTVTIPNDIASFQNFAFVTADTFLAENYSNERLVVSFVCGNSFQYLSAVHQMTQGNHSYNGTYGSGITGTSTSVVSQAVNIALNHTPSSSTTSSMAVDNTGKLLFTVSSSRPLRAGTYEIIAWLA